jgi:hypothetical protein
MGWIGDDPHVVESDKKKGIMVLISPQTIYENLKLLEDVDIASSAFYRELAQDVLADPKVTLTWRQAIADRLNRANHRLERVTVGENDSY